jgi:hypothetical protein
LGDLYKDLRYRIFSRWVIDRGAVCRHYMRGESGCQGPEALAVRVLTASIGLAHSQGSRAVPPLRQALDLVANITWAMARALTLAWNVATVDKMCLPPPLRTLRGPGRVSNRCSVNHCQSIHIPMRT